MTEHLEMFEPKAIASDETSAGYAEVVQPSENNLPSDLADELEGVAKRVRKRLKNMNARHMELGCDLQAVRDRLSRGQFRSWVTLACGLAPRTARLLIRGADQTLTALSTIQKGVPSRLSQGQRLDRRVVKVMVRAAKAHKPTSKEQNGRRHDAAQRCNR